MRRNALLVGPLLVACVVVASCGARTGLELKPRHDAGRDASSDATFDVGLDAPRDVEHIPDVIPPQDGHFLDAKADCDTPTYCKPDDPNYIYKCGVRIFQCGSLEQCEERCGDGAPPRLWRRRSRREQLHGEVCEPVPRHSGAEHVERV